MMFSTPEVTDAEEDADTLEQKSTPDAETLEQMYLRKYPTAIIPSVELKSTRLEGKPYYFIKGNTIKEGTLLDTRSYRDNKEMYCLIRFQGRNSEVEIFDDDTKVFDKNKVQEIKRRNMEDAVFSQNKVLPPELNGVIKSFNGGKSKRKRTRKTKTRRLRKAFTSRFG